MRVFRSTVLVFAAMALAVVALKARQQKTGSPEEHLPSNITQLTAFGERASWSPDGKRIAFMSKSFGDAFVDRPPDEDDPAADGTTRTQATSASNTCPNGDFS